MYYTWSVRIYDACKRDSPGGLLVYQGQARRTRGAAADPTDDDEQPYVSTSQLIVIISRHQPSLLGTHTRPTDEVVSPEIWNVGGSPSPLILAPEVHPRAGRGLTQVDRPVLPPSTHCFISLQVIPSIHLIGHPTRGDTSPFTLPRPRPFNSAQGTAST